MDLRGAEAMAEARGFKRCQRGKDLVVGVPGEQGVWAFWGSVIPAVGQSRRSQLWGEGEGLAPVGRPCGHAQQAPLGAVSAPKSEPWACPRGGQRSVGASTGLQSPGPDPGPAATSSVTSVK